LLKKLSEDFSNLEICYCAVPENIHTPLTEGIGISWGVRGSGRPKNVKKCMKLNWNFQRDGEVLEKTLLWGEYGYFLELHIDGLLVIGLILHACSI